MNMLLLGVLLWLAPADVRAEGIAPVFARNLAPEPPTKEFPIWVEDLPSWISKEPGAKAFVWQAIMSETKASISEAERSAEYQFRRQCKQGFPPYAKAYFRILEGSRHVAFFLCKEAPQEPIVKSLAPNRGGRQPGVLLGGGTAFGGGIIYPMFSFGYSWNRLGFLFSAGYGERRDISKNILGPITQGGSVLSGTKTTTKKTRSVPISIGIVVPVSRSFAFHLGPGVEYREESTQEDTYESISIGGMTVTKSANRLATEKSLRMRYGGGLQFQVWRLGLRLDATAGGGLKPHYATYLFVKL